MFKTAAEKLGWALAVLFLSACVAGCGGDGTAGDPEEIDASSKDPKKEALSPEALGKLPAFDALDGAVDRVVHLCAGCNFSMDGKEENPMELGDYTLHFCNPHCAERFKKDTDTKLLALEAKTE